jgi:hypothetical protein
MKKSFVLVCFIILVIFISGCQANETDKTRSVQDTNITLPSATIFLTNTTAPTNTALPTETPSPTNTDVPPTETFTPTITASPVPSPTLNLELQMVFRNGCDVPVTVEVTGPMSFSVTIESRELKNVYALVGTYTFWNDRTRERREYQLFGSTFPYCICMKICHVNP